MTSSNSSEDNCGAASSLIFGAFAGAVDVDAGDDDDDDEDHLSNTVSVLVQTDVLLVEDLKNFRIVTISVLIIIIIIIIIFIIITMKVNVKKRRIDLPLL